MNHSRLSNISKLTLMLLILVSGYSQADDHTLWLSGYSAEIRGETINYHSFLPKEYPALLVRNLEKENYIEWQTAAVPAELESEKVTFVWIAAYDTDPKRHLFRLSVDGKEIFSFHNPQSNDDNSWTQKNKEGFQLSFKSSHIDRHEDQFGFMRLTVPQSRLTPGKPVKIKVVGESAGHRTWFMIFKYPLSQGIRFHQEPALIKKGERLEQLITAEIVQLGGNTPIEISADGNKTKRELNFGFNTIRFPVKQVAEETSLTVKVTKNKHTATYPVKLSPVKPMTIHLLHHSHVDIGYTHTQDEVKQIQFSNLDTALKLIGENDKYPEAAKFRWNMEVVWPLQDWLVQAGEQERKAFINAVKKGYIDVHGFFANQLTGLCRDEEMMRVLDVGQNIAANSGFKIKSAMITDIPGFSWGVVSALSKAGIKYFSMGPNRGHRIGYFLEKNADKPFWWVSASGKEKILCWVHGEGYSLFHTGLGYKKLDSKLTPRTIFELLKTLEKHEYPYPLIPLRYNIGSDNGPPDPYVSEMVTNWNAKYASPKLVLDTTSPLLLPFCRKTWGKPAPIQR